MSIKANQIFSSDTISAYVVAVGPIANNCGIILNHVRKTFFVIDAGQGLKIFLDDFIPHDYELTSVFITHAHWDHIGDVNVLKKCGAKIFCHEKDKIVIEDPDILIKYVGRNYGLIPTVVDATYNDCDCVNENDIGIEIKHVPGHNEGSLTFYIKDINAVFTGDTLFAGCIGRTDFYGGNEALLVKNIREKILILPSDVVVVPGHGLLTTIESEKQNNEFFN